MWFKRESLLGEHMVKFAHQPKVAAPPWGYGGGWATEKSPKARRVHPERYVLNEDELLAWVPRSTRRCVVVEDLVCR